MSPFEIRIALHYHTRCEDCEQTGVPIGHTTMSWFIENGLLTHHSEDEKQHYHPTEKLHAYCYALQEVPLPVQKWVMPEK